MNTDFKLEYAEAQMFIPVCLKFRSVYYLKAIQEVKKSVPLSLETNAILKYIVGYFPAKLGSCGISRKL